MIKHQFGDLVAPESTSKQEVEQRTIEFAREPFLVRGLLYSFPLFCELPSLTSSFFTPLTRSIPASRISTQKPTLLRLIREPPNCPEPEVDCTSCEVTGLEMHPMAESRGDSRAWHPA